MESITEDHISGIYLQGPALYGQLLDRFNSFFTTGSIPLFFLSAQVFFCLYSTVDCGFHYSHYALSEMQYFQIQEAKHLVNQPLRSSRDEGEAKKESVCVKRTNRRFIWALSLYHQLSESAASIEMELGPGEVHSFIRAQSR